MIGLGAMSRDLRASLKRRYDAFDVSAALISPGHGADLHGETGMEIFDDPDELIAWKPSLVVECAGHSAVRNVVPVLLGRGIDTIIASIGSLADANLLHDLEAAAVAGNSRLTVVSGAIGGLDALRAAKLAGLASVKYTGRKPPIAWKGSAAESMCDLSRVSEPVMFFTGTAAEAAKLFPKNANVTAAVALAGVGFKDTSVALIADPAATLNSHQVEARGAFGEFTICLRNTPLPDNPKTSRLAALSVQEAVVRHFDRVDF